MVDLPTEILSAIFTESNEPPPSLDECRHPQELSLRLVSYRWHAIVDNTPQLWCAVGFSISSWAWPVDPEISARRLSFRLEKSKSSPLDVSIDLGESRLYSTWDDDEHRSTLGPATDHPRIHLARHLLVLMPHAHRFRTIDVTFAWYAALSQTLEPLRNVSSPLLKRISISYHQPRCLDLPEDENSLLLGGTPALRELQLFDVSLPQYKPPLSGITSLILSTSRSFAFGFLANAVTLAAVFAELTSLVWLRLYGGISVDYIYPPIAIPSLQHLYVYCHYGTGHDTDLGYFYLPALKSLRIHRADTSFHSISSSSNDLSPKFPTVQTLDFFQASSYSWLGMPPPLSRKLAHNFPNLESLTLSCAKRNDLIPQAEFIRDNADCFPLLKALDFRMRLGDDDILVSMLQQRIACCRPIITCGFMFDRIGGEEKQMDYLKNALSEHYEVDDRVPALHYVENWRRLQMWNAEWVTSNIDEIPPLSEPGSAQTTVTCPRR